MDTFIFSVLVLALTGGVIGFAFGLLGIGGGIAIPEEINSQRNDRGVLWFHGKL